MVIKETERLSGKKTPDKKLSKKELLRVKKTIQKEKSNTRKLLIENGPHKDTIGQDPLLISTHKLLTEIFLEPKIYLQAL